jgi:hypothetical protein
LVHTRPAVVKQGPVYEDGDEVHADGNAVACKLTGWRASRVAALRQKAEGDDAGANQQKTHQVKP